MQSIKLVTVNIQYFYYEDTITTIYIYISSDVGTINLSKLTGISIPQTTATVPQGVFSAVACNQFFKIGNVVFVNFSATLATSIAGSNGVLCTLPSNYRPEVNTEIIILGKYGNLETGPQNGVVKPNGIINTGTGSGTFSGKISIIGSFNIS